MLRPCRRAQVFNNAIEVALKNGQTHTFRSILKRDKVFDGLKAMQQWNIEIEEGQVLLLLLLLARLPPYLTLRAATAKMQPAQPSTIRTCRSLARKQLAVQRTDGGLLAQTER